MAFNLGAFAGGLVSGGLKTYTTLKEQERLDTAEARDKERFAEEQRKIQLQQEAEEISRKAAIPTAATSPGANLNAVVAALPIGGSETNPEDITKTPDAYREKFNEVFGGLNPQQQALVLRQYGDTSTPGGAALEASQKTAGAPEALAGLNAAVVRQDAGGGRSVVQADTDEKAIVARHKALAMASGNPLAIKAAHEAEATMLNREVAQQQLALGAQNLSLGAISLSNAKTAAEFTERFNKSLVAAKEENSKLLHEVDTAISKNGVTVESLLNQFGSKIKDATGQSYYAKDGKVFTKDAAGNETVVAGSLDQAVGLLKQGAGAHFAKDLSDRIVREGLFKDPNAFNDFYKAEREWVNTAADIANKRVMAAAATKNAESSAVSAGAAATTAKASADKVAAELKAGIPEAHASLYRAQAGSASAMADHYRGLTKLANENAALNKSTREEVQAALAEYEKLTPAQQAGEEGVAALAKASMIYAKKSGDITGLINAIKKPDGSDIKPADVATFVQNFGSSASSFRDEKGNFKPISQLNPQEAMEEMRRMMGGKGAGAGGLPDTAPKPEAGPAKAAEATVKTAIPVAPIAGSPAAIEVEKRKAAADAKEQATKTLRDAATAAATAAISASSQVDARKVQQMEGFSLLPVAVQAQISKIVNKPVSAIPAAKSAGPSAAELAEDAEVAKVNAELAAKNKAAPAAPAAGKSVKAQEEDLSYKVVVAKSNYDRRPGATTKAQLDSAQQELANFRKANGIK